MDRGGIHTTLAPNACTPEASDVSCNRRSTNPDDFCMEGIVTDVTVAPSKSVFEAPLTSLQSNEPTAKNTGHRPKKKQRGGPRRSSKKTQASVPLATESVPCPPDKSPSDQHPPLIAEEEPGLVHGTGQRLSEHVLVKYGVIRQKQKQFLANLGALSLQNGGDDRLLSAHLINTSLQESKGSIPEKLLHQCENDLHKLGSLLTQHPQNSIATNVNQPTLALHTNVTMLSRAYEERFLHEASGCERPCVNSASRSCFANLIESNAVLDPTFALTEFYLPHEYTKIEQNGWVWPSTLRPCLLCLRNQIFSQLFNVR